ncbi:MAG: DegT/DnrJ/EryC1/StrS family aminotransferase [Acidobacteria bacterium]|nr:MAG: DegT/DnrJ/EryC1/StrS family aminotransferase [Acidobacteriota bacterium]REJ99095.1 MAG: DegT/DnrJ/EryC1/StrS family aminotransferase [Acidobacteriota bacterium]REK16185.1 MAG: DegT/DnrJ/EryC1/StrS family aminotransferase [Acidobacteriota bacterium]REK43866.1 MAG: DegT/DnrJ/EryC1/StrS family aminotransferase [Acidobacteriota bacterium]
MKNIQMVDLVGQYEKIKDEIDAAVLEVIGSAAFINGPAVKQFQADLEDYLGVKHVIACANGTDALQIALMALGLEPGDKVIVPSFTYVATAEVIALLRLKPVMVDVDPDTFNVTAEIVEAALTKDTKAIVPVHLFGQSCDIEPIVELARDKGIPVVEDNAQAIGAVYTFQDGSRKRAGTIGEIGTTSFYPAKNLGCYGDGGAMFTNDDELAGKLRMIANHGQSRTYYHDVIGVNSRLDSIQAAVLDVKLKYLDEYAEARKKVAGSYDEAFEGVEAVQAPVRQPNSTHVFHQYTIRVRDGRRDDLKDLLAEEGIPSSIFYPVPLNKQKAFKPFVDPDLELPVTEQLCKEVLSLPIHTEMEERSVKDVAQAVGRFFS